MQNLWHLRFPRAMHETQETLTDYRIPRLWNFLSPYFMGYLDFVFGDVCWHVCTWRLWIISTIFFSGMGSSYPFVSAKLGVAFRSIWRDMINVKMVDWPTYLNWALSSLLSCILSQNIVANSQPSQPHAISSAAGASPRAVVKVRVIRAQSTWSLEKVGYNCCNLCSTYPPGNPHIPPLEK